MNLPAQTCSPSEHDIAMNLAKNQLGDRLSAPDFCGKYGIEIFQLRALAKSEYFKQLVASYKKELSEDNEGIRLKSAIALEACIPRLYRMIQHQRTPPAAIVSGVKQLAEMAGVTREEKAITGTGFSIQIDLSGLQKAADTINAANAGKTVIQIQAEREHNVLDAEVIK